MPIKSRISREKERETDRGTIERGREREQYRERGIFHPLQTISGLERPSFPQQITQALSENSENTIKPFPPGASLYCCAAYSLVIISIITILFLCN
jgi:hypothetical protein